MTAFLRHLSDDLHHGRETWRVLGLISLVSFLVTVGIHLRH